MSKSARPHKKGFTLVEIIVSIGVLAVVSVFVLRMFVQSENTQAKARDMDFAVLQAGSVIERIKTFSAPGDIMSAYPQATQADGSYSLELYFGGDYAKAGPAGEADFTLLASFRQTESTQAGELWDIDIKLVRHKPYLLNDKRDTDIYRAWSEKYFPSI